MAIQWYLSAVIENHLVGLLFKKYSYGKSLKEFLFKPRLHDGQSSLWKMSSVFLGEGSNLRRRLAMVKVLQIQEMEREPGSWEGGRIKVWEDVVEMI